MGTRLGIIEKKDYFYATKLFGYEDAGKLKSAKYLLEIKKINEDDLDLLYCGWENIEIQLDCNEFKKFAVLYNEDLNNFVDEFIENKDWFINQKEIKELLDSPYDKILNWG